MKITSVDMDTNNRQHHIIKYLLQQSGTFSIKALQDLLVVSKETLRKDLIALENNSLITRSYGQVSLKENEATTSFLIQQGLLSTDERRAEVLKFLKKQKRYRVIELAKVFHVSPATIRNDLMFFEEQGILRKDHGVVTYLAGSELTGIPESGRAMPQLRINMAEQALSHIETGDTIFLDNSLFCQHMARSISSNSSVFIITNSLGIVMILAERDFPLEVFMLPGVLVNHNRTLRVSFSESVFEHLHINRAFFCFSSYFSGDFFTDSQAAFDTGSQIMRHSDHIYGFLLADSLGKKGAIKFPLDEFAGKINEILLDGSVDLEQAPMFFPRKLPVVICGEHGVAYHFSGEQYRIGLLAYTSKNEFIRTVKHSLEDVIKEQANVSLNIREVDNDYTNVIQNIDVLIDEQPDLIIDFSLNFETSIYMTERCTTAGIPFISIDNPSFGAVYFGANNQEAGEIAGNMAAEAIIEKWDGELDAIIVVEKTDAGPVVKSRISGTIETLRKRLQQERIDTRFLPWLAGNPHPETEFLDALDTLKPEQKCLFIFFHLQSTLDLLPLLSAHRDNVYTIAVGHNRSSELDRLLTGQKTPFIGCVDYAPQQYGRNVLALAMEMLNGKTPSPMNYTEHSWVPNTYYS